MSDEQQDSPGTVTDAKRRVFGDIDGDPAGSDTSLPKPLPEGSHTGKLPDEIIKRWLLDVDEFIRLWKDSEDFSIQLPYLLELGWEEPFFGSLSRRVLKVKSANLPTAGVRILDGQLEMLWNPIFFKHDLEKASKEYPKGVIKHELYHIIFEHITNRRQTPHVLWNAATDCAINSLIPRNELPAFTLMPGELYVPPDAKPDWKPSIIASIIKDLPKEKAAEWYMHHLMQDPEVKAAMERAKDKCACASKGSGSPSDDKQDERDFNAAFEKELYGKGGGQFDDHDIWDQISDEDRDMMRDYVRDIFRDCVREAESHSRGWGSVPESIKQHLKKVISKDVDWRDLINQFIGRSRSTKTTSSIKRVNRRVPWEFPGRKRMYSAKPANAIDQSGSMLDWWVELLFAELGNLGSIAEYDIIPFDYTVDEKNIQTIRRGQRPVPIRTRSGGTSFDAPVEYVNNHKDIYDCLFILTDGGCSAPKKCKLPMAYILAPGCQLLFDPKDTPVIKMSDTRKK